MKHFTKRLKAGIAALALIYAGNTQAQSFTQLSAYDTIVTTPDTLRWNIVAPDTVAWGTASLTVYYDGDFGSSSEFITIMGEGGYTVGVTHPYFDGSDCMSDSVTLTFPASMINGWAADDTLRFIGVTSSNVDYFCTTNHARIRLSYNYCLGGGAVASISSAMSSLCAIDGSVNITAAPSGGTLSGTGVSGMVFDPAGLAPGSYTVTYTYTNSGGCTSTAATSISILEGPVISGTFDTICPGGSSVLTTTGEGHLVWYSDAALTMPVDTGYSYTTPALATTTTYYSATTLMDNYFVMNSFSDSDSMVIDHNGLTGDDRGGIAVTNSHVYIVGDDFTARFDLNLAGGVNFPRMDGLFSDLANGQLYTLYNPVTGIPDANFIDSMYITELRTLNSDLTLGTGVITLSDSIPFGWDNAYNYTSGVFPGNGFLIIYSSPRQAWYVIDLQDGVVTPLGTLANPEFYYSESWSAWGVGEFNGVGYSVLYRDETSQNIHRRMLPDMAPSVAYSFADISDMASFTYAPWNNRWYMHFEGGSQFNGSGETAVYATAGDSTGIEMGTTTIHCPAAYTIFVDACVSIEEQNIAAVAIYPNPSNGRFTISLSNMEDATLEIFSLEGRLVHSERMNGAAVQKEIDLSALSNGIYHVRVSSRDEVLSSKLVKY